VVAEPARRILLRPLDEATARDVVDGRRHEDWSPGYPTDGDRDISRFLTERPPASDCATVFRPFQIVIAASGTVVGGIGCHRPPDVNGTVEIGYGIAAEWRNQGLTTEAVSALVDDLRTTGVRRVVARTSPDNRASQAVLRHCGFVQRHVGHDGFLVWDLELRSGTRPAPGGADGTLSSG
jgi:RimJ/RimL family protein N-acetyltransferase